MNEQVPISHSEYIRLVHESNRVPGLEQRIEELEDELANEYELSWMSNAATAGLIRGYYFGKLVALQALVSDIIDYLAKVGAIHKAKHYEVELQKIMEGGAYDVRESIEKLRDIVATHDMSKEAVAEIVDLYDEIQVEIDSHYVKSDTVKELLTELADKAWSIGVHGVAKDEFGNSMMYNRDELVDEFVSRIQEAVK